MNNRIEEGSFDRELSKKPFIKRILNIFGRIQHGCAGASGEREPVPDTSSPIPESESNVPLNGKGYPEFPPQESVVEYYGSGVNTTPSDWV